MLTHAGHLNHMSLQRQYKKAQTRLTYPTWLKSIWIPDLMAKHNFGLQDPAAFNTIPKGHITTFFIQEWETFYKKLERTLDTWSLHLPTT